MTFGLHKVARLVGDLNAESFDKLFDNDFEEIVSVWNRKRGRFKILHGLAK